MFKDSLDNLIRELEKKEGLEVEVLSLKKISEDLKDPAENMDEMGPSKDDLYTNKAPAFGGDTELENVGLVVGDRVKLLQSIPEIPELPVGTMGTVVNTETPEEGMIGVEWEQRAGYWNMLPEEIEKIKVVKTNTEASLKKASIDWNVAYDEDSKKYRITMNDSLMKEKFNSSKEAWNWIDEQNRKNASLEKKARYVQLLAVYQGENGLLQAPGLKEVIVPLDKLNHYISDEWSKNEMIGPDHKEQSLSGSSEGLYAFLVDNKINIDDLINTDYQFEITSQEDLEDYFNEMDSDSDIEASLKKNSSEDEKPVATDSKGRVLEFFENTFDPEHLWSMSVTDKDGKELWYSDDSILLEDLLETGVVDFDKPDESIEYLLNKKNSVVINSTASSEVEEHVQHLADEVYSKMMEGETEHSSEVYEAILITVADNYDPNLEVSDYINLVNSELDLKAAINVDPDDMEKTKIIQIFKSNPKKLKLFSDLVAGSVQLKEISQEDLLEWNEALAKTALKDSAEEAWGELADVALKLFHKTRTEEK